VYSVNQKIPERFFGIFPKPLGIFSSCFTNLLYIPIYAGLQIFVQLPAIFLRSYATLSAITQFTPYLQTVCHRPGRNARWHFLIVSPNSWEFLVEILHTNCTFKSTLDNEFLSNYLQLWRSYSTQADPECVSTDGGHFEHIMVVVLNMA